MNDGDWYLTLDTTKDPLKSGRVFLLRKDYLGNGKNRKSRSSSANAKGCQKFRQPFGQAVASTAYRGQDFFTSASACCQCSRMAAVRAALALPNLMGTRFDFLLIVSVDGRILLGDVASADRFSLGQFPSLGTV
jgi:hypothetical protein